MVLSAEITAAVEAHLCAPVLEVDDTVELVVPFLVAVDDLGNDGMRTEPCLDASGSQKPGLHTGAPSH